MMDNRDDGYMKNTSHSSDNGNNRQEIFDNHDIKAPASLLPRLMQRLQASQHNEQLFITIATITSLQAALDSADEFVRAAAIRRLAMWEGDISSLPVNRLLAALSDSSWLVREATIFTLDALRIEVSHEHQMMMLLDENEFVREAARMTFATGSSDTSGYAEAEAMLAIALTRRQEMRERIYHVLHSIDSLFFSIHLFKRKDSIMESHHHDSKGDIATSGTFSQAQLHPHTRLGIIGTLVALVVIVGIALSWFVAVQTLPHTASKHIITPLDRPIFTDTEQMNYPQLHWLDGRQITISDPLQIPYVNRWDVHIQYLHQDNLFGLVAQNTATSQYGDIQYSWTPDNKYVVNSIAAPDTTPTTTSVPTNYAVTIEVISVETAQTLVTVSYHEKIVPSFANNNGKSVTPPATYISPDDTRLAVGQNDGNITIWSLQTGKQVASYHLDSSPVDFVQWSANSQRLLTQSSSGLAGLWDTTTGKEISSFQPPSYEQQINTSSGQKYQTPATPLLSPDGTLMAAVVAPNNKVDIWDAVTTKIVDTYTQPTHQISYVTWLPDSKTLSLYINGTSSMSNGTSLETWSLATNHIGLHIATPAPDSSPTFSPSSKYVAVESASSKDITIWSTATDKQITTLHNGVTLSQDTSTDFRGSPGQFVKWSPDERYVATISKDQFNPSLNNVIRVWEVTTGKLVMQYHSNSNQVLQVAWSPDGKYLASVSEDDTGDVMEVWQAPH
ncbi:MAG TPA: hypothetical protein DHW02_02700 [Ktedonobacter sp.]|nr:hypothetical protein [Ktedonobacter sp.]